MQVLGVLGNKGISELGQSLAKLRQDLRPNDVLYGLLGRGVGVILNLELDITKKPALVFQVYCNSFGHRAPAAFHEKGFL